MTGIMTGSFGFYVNTPYGGVGAYLELGAQAPAVPPSTANVPSEVFPILNADGANDDASGPVSPDTPAPSGGGSSSDGGCGEGGCENDLG